MNTCDVQVGIAMLGSVANVDDIMIEFQNQVYNVL